MSESNYFSFYLDLYPPVKGIWAGKGGAVTSVVEVLILEHPVVDVVDGVD